MRSRRSMFLFEVFFLLRCYCRYRTLSATVLIRLEIYIYNSLVLPS